MELGSFQAALSRLKTAFVWVPDWAIGLLLLTLATIAALLMHRAIIGTARRVIAERHAFLRLLLSQTTAPTRLALIILALGVALKLAPFDPAVAAEIGHVLLLGFIVLVGWFAIIALRLATTIYLRRFRLDAEDNFLARKHVTQVRILERATDTLVIVITAAWALMTFEAVRQYGVSLFASAGVAGLAVGLAARPVLSNLIAGVQIAMSQPIRLDDAVVVENEWGRVEDITATYVVIRLWDLRRLIVPLNYFIEKPFQNWTRESTALIGSVSIHVDYTAPVERIRQKLAEIVSRSTLWDGQVAKLQVIEARESTIELRAMVSAASSSATADLRCEVREQLIAFLQQEHPHVLPRQRTEIDLSEAARANLETAAISRASAA